MKNPIKKFTLTAFCLLTPRLCVLATYVKKDWHQPLATLYYKQVQKKNRKDVRSTIQLLEKALKSKKGDISQIEAVDLGKKRQYYRLSKSLLTTICTTY